MKQYICKPISIICIFAIFLSFFINLPSSVQAINTEPIVFYPELKNWTVECDWAGTGKMKISDDMIVMQNNGGNHFVVTQTVTVKPNTSYRFSAMVRIENYKPTEKNESGASVRYGGAYDSSSFENQFNTTSEWKKSNIIFTTQNQTSIQISLAVGCWSAACEGTAYFKDMVLDELTTNNQWNVLALIYKNVELSDFKNSFLDKDIQKLKTMLSEFPAAVMNLSASRMLIGDMDIQVIDTPITSVSGDWGDLTTGENGDIQLDTYLEGRDYQQIVVYAPLVGAPNYNGWAGLGGTWYEYNGQKIYYLTISTLLDIGNKKWNIYGGNYDSDTSCLLHEMLHCVETNSSYFRGWSDFTPVHNNSDHGYVSEDVCGWLDWYAALMRDDGLDGKGFKPQSFLVTHVPNVNDGNTDNILGDINHDGIVDEADKNYLQRYFAGYNLPLPESIYADMDQDGFVTRRDVMIISRYCAGWDDYSLLY